MTDRPIDLSVCIINHRTPDLTRACLRSVAIEGRNLALEVIVVNNTADPLELEDLTFGANGARLIFLQNEAPLGFSANQNKMLQRAVGRYLMALNSDTVIAAGTLEELVGFMERHPDCGVAGPRLEHPDGTLQPSCRNFPTPVTHFIEAAGLLRFLRRVPGVGHWLWVAGRHDRVQWVDWLSGACLIARADAVHAVGMFDAALFPGLFGEDLEWCWRFRRAGWRVGFDPAARVIHHENATPLDDRLLKMYAGTYRFIARNHSRLTRLGFRLATVLALAPRLLLTRDRNARAVLRRVMAEPVG